MVSKDYDYMISQLERKVAALEKAVSQKRDFEPIANQDWDNATLMREWNICERTAANYRKQGLGYYKRGGRIFYTLEQREKFLYISERKSHLTLINGDKEGLKCLNVSTKKIQGAV